MFTASLSAIGESRMDSQSTKLRTFFFAWRSDMTPGLQLQQLLGEDAQIGEEPHIVFSEMQELRYEQGVLGEWKEKAR